MTNNNAKNGNNFERRVEKLLKKLGISFLSQYTVEGNEERLDILIIDKSGRKVNLSVKLSLRERYKMCGIEALHLKEAYPNSITYIITADSDNNIALTRQAIKKSKTLKKVIKEVVHVDDLKTLLKKLKPRKMHSKPRRIKNFVDYRSNL